MKDMISKACRRFSLSSGETPNLGDHFIAVDHALDNLGTGARETPAAQIQAILRKAATMGLGSREAADNNLDQYDYAVQMTLNQ